MMNLFQKTPAKEEPDNTKETIVGFNSLVYSNNAFSYYNPDTLIIKRGNRVYKNMLADEQVKACYNLKVAAVLGRGYCFEAKNDEHQRIADFFYTANDQMESSFSNILRGVLSGFKNGFSISEKVSKPIEWDGKPYWGLKDIKLKPWDTFNVVVDQYGTIEKLEQSVSMGSAKNIPLDKVVYWVYQPDIDRYYGESDLRAAYRAWWSKDIAIKFQNIHLERHGSGFATMQPGEKAKTDPTIKNRLISILNNLSVRTGIYVPKGYTFDIKNPIHTDAYEKAVAQHDKSIAKAMLLPNLLGLSEQGNTGSYSQSQTQFDVFLWIIDEICNSITECLNEQVYADLALLNFGTNDIPKFKFDPLTDEKKKALASAWSELAQKGVVTNTEQDEAYTRSLLGYPEKQEDIIDEESENEDIGGDIDEYTFKAEMGNPWIKRVKFKEIDRSMNKAEKDFSESLTSLMAKARLSIETQIEKIAGRRSFGNIDLKEFGTVGVPKGVLTSIRKLIRTQLKSVFDENYNRAAVELPKKINAAQIVGMDKTKAEKFLANKSIKITDILSTDVLKSVQQVLENSVKYDKTLKETMIALESETSVVSMLPETDRAGRAINVPARLENIVRTNVADAVNQSRMSLFGRPEFKGFVRAYEYSAILDQRVSDVCETLSGRIKRDWAEFTPPNHHQCRSILVPVTLVDDWDGKESNIPTNTKPLKGFG